MSDYRLSTEELREIYKWAPNDEARHIEFDRWLAEVERAAEERGYKRGYADAELQAQYQESVSEGVV